VSDTYFERTCDVVKTDDELGLVFGFAMICSKNGEPYVDLQDDFIPERAMLKAAVSFMSTTDRISGDMHAKADGKVVFAFPLTSDIAKALDIETQTTGLLIAMRPSEEVLNKFKSGEYTGFSIGGIRRVDREI